MDLTTPWLQNNAHCNPIFPLLMRGVVPVVFLTDPLLINSRGLSRASVTERPYQCGQDFQTGHTAAIGEDSGVHEEGRSVTFTSRCLGPSSSTSKTDCQVPSTSLPLETGIDREAPITDEAMCDQA